MDRPNRTQPFGFEDLAEVLRGTGASGAHILLLVVAANLFFLIVNGSWRAVPDAALYLELGQSLIKGTGYVFNGEQHTYVPPGYAILVWAMGSVFGPTFFTYRVMMALMGFWSAYLGYRLVRRVAGPDVGCVLGGLVLVNHTLLENSTFTTSDVPFAFFVLVAMLATLSAVDRQGRLWWILPAGLLSGLPALIRINGWGIPPACLFFLLCRLPDSRPWERVGKGVLFLAVALAPGIGWEAYKAAFPASFSEVSYVNAVGGRSLGTQMAIMLDAAWGYGAEITYALTAASIKTGIIEWFFVGLVLAGMVYALRNGDRLLVPLAAIQLCGLTLSPAGSRYLAALIPSLYLFLVLGMLHVGRWIKGRPQARNRKAFTPARFILVGCIIMGVANLVQDARTIYRARTALEPYGAESQRDLPYFTAANWVKNHAPGAVVLSMHPRVFHFLSGAPTVELVRSGVPEDQVWVKDPTVIRGLLERRKPSFVFVDRSQPQMVAGVREALRMLDLEPEEIPEAQSSQRFSLWRIVPAARESENAEPAPPDRKPTLHRNEEAR